MILCSDGSLYTGISNDVARRFGQHADRQGAKYFRGRQPKQLVYVETGHDRSSASKRESAIKKLPRQEKFQLLESGLNQVGQFQVPDKLTKPLLTMYSKQIFDQDCRQCKRLDDFLVAVKQKHPDYHARPVAPFGDSNAELLVVGLAPGMHGANATGRPFTGDYAGLLLYETLYEFGYSNQITSESLTDGLVLKNCRITNAVKCLPPQNKPTGDEIGLCNSYLTAEIETLPEHAVILALGSIAHQAVLKAHGLKLGSAKFGHNAKHDLPNGRTLVDSYHSSRYNVQTKRLTKEMFADVFRTIEQARNKNRPC